MAMINNVFVNMGLSGSFESAEGIGEVSFSGVRNFLKHDWPQMDIGHIEFYNPAIATDETAINRRLTRNQAYWLANQVAAFMNALDIPDEDQFKTFGHGHGTLKKVHSDDTSNEVAAVPAPSQRQYNSIANHTYEIGDRVKARDFKLSVASHIDDVFTVIGIEPVPHDQIEFNPHIPEEVNETGVGHHQWLTLQGGAPGVVSGLAVQLANRVEL